MSSISLQDRLDLPAVNQRISPPRVADSRSVWVYVRTNGRHYSACVRRTLPLGDGVLLERPDKFSECETLADLLEAAALDCPRPIWHPYEDFLSVPERSTLRRDHAPGHYLCGVRRTGKHIDHVIGRVVYTGRSPDIGHAVGCYEIECGRGASYWTTVVDRLVEARHLLCVAAGLVALDPNVTYLCEVPGGER